MYYYGRKEKLKKPGWIEEFKAFAIKGNALSMAVGVIIGGGFLPSPNPSQTM